MAFFFLHFFLSAYADLLRAASAMDEEPRLVLALAVRKVRCVEESILATFNASGYVCVLRLLIYMCSHTIRSVFFFCVA